MGFTTSLVSHQGKQASAQLVILELDVTPDTSYPTGGEAFDAAALLQSLGLYDKAPSVLAVLGVPKNGYSFEWDRTNKKLKILKKGNPDYSDMAFGSSGLAIGTGSKAKVLIANTVNYLIDGEWKQKTTAEIAFTATTHDITADGATVQEAYYLLTINAGGTVTITKGTTADTGLGELPAAPAGEAVLGWVKLEVAAGAVDFDATTDELDEAHITDTYVNAAFVPDQLDLLGVSEVAASTNLVSPLGVFRVLIFAN